MPQKVVIFGGKLMGYWSSFCLKFFLSTKITIKGLENINHNQKFFIAASHQSMFETFFLQTIFNGPIFILKNELLQIPIFGWYLKKIGSISIRRNKITKENLGFLDDIIKHVNESNRPLIIFPQATRVRPYERPPFKKGVGKIYEQLKIECLPLAINSGVVWPKTGKKKSGKETLPVKFDHELEISFNSRYLIDVASQLDGDKIELFLNDTGSPALIKDPGDFDSIFVVMPMKG